MSEFSNKNNLSIRFSAEGFSLSISDRWGQILSARTIAGNMFSQDKSAIIDMLSGVTELNTAYDTTRLICESDIYTIVPDDFYDESLTEEFLRTQHPDRKPEGKTVCNKLLAWNAVIIFSLPEELFGVLNGTFPEIEIEHHLFAFVNDCVALQDSTSVFAANRNGKLDAVVIKEGNLQLINTFPYVTKEDFLYQLLNIYTVMELDREECPLKLFFEKPKAGFEALMEKYFTIVESNSED